MATTSTYLNGHVMTTTSHPYYCLRYWSWSISNQVDDAAESPSKCPPCCRDEVGSFLAHPSGFGSKI